MKNADFLFAFLGSQILVGNGGYWFLTKKWRLLWQEIVIQIIEAIVSAFKAPSKTGHFNYFSLVKE